MEPKAQEKKPFTKRHAVLFTLLSVVLAAAILFGTMLLSGAAGADLSASRNEENEEYLSIIAHNVEYSEYMHLYYALDLNLPESARAEDVRMLFWSAPQESYDKDNENVLYSVSGNLGSKIEMGNEVYESPYLFRSKGIAPKEIGDTIYARAYVTDSEGNTYYSRVDKFGVLQYVHAMYRTKELGYTVTDEQMHLYATILNYGARAQRIFNYKTDRLVSDHTVRIEAVNGTGADGFSTGIYFVGDTVTLTANEAPEGQAFVRWENAAGEVVSEEESFSFAVTEETKSEVYKVVYSTAGLVYTLQSDDTYSVTGYTGTDTNVIMPRKYLGKSVAGIYYRAFHGCSSLTSVTIPDSVATIGYEAFEGCTSLTSVYITDIAAWCNISWGSGNSSTSLNNPLPSNYSLYLNGKLLTKLEIPQNVKWIREYAFYRCISLTSVVIPDSVTNIGHSAFRYCSNLASVTIGDNVTSIGSYAFSACKTLTGITIPNSITSISSSLFSGCSSLASVIFEENSKFYSIGSYAFNGCSSLKSVTIPDSVTSIDYAAFSECTSLTSVSIPDSVMNIGTYAFSGCTNLTSVAISDSISSINEGAFDNCSSLTSVSIPDSVTNIGTYAFRGCTNLTSVALGENSLLQKIGSYAFSNCINLTSLTIPAGVTSISSSAFGRCTSLTKITVDEGNSTYKSIDDNLYSNDGKTLILYCKGKTDTGFTIPDSVTSIGNGAFIYCANLTSVTIPDSVVSIGDDAFFDCDSLTSVVWGENSQLQSIGAYAFYDCSQLTNITIPDSVTSVGNFSFRGCTSITSITIPSSLISIGNQAFYGCKNLTSLTFEVNSRLQSIGNGAFYSCSKLTNISIPKGVTSIGSEAFDYCSGLTTVTIPDSVTSIGYYAFRSYNLTIYCEAQSKPDGWSSIWKGSSGFPIVVWGYVPEY